MHGVGERKKEEDDYCYYYYYCVFGLGFVLGFGFWIYF